jgi:hypothetical protein
MFVTAAGNALCLQVLFFAIRKTSHWWTCLLSTACSNIRSATLQYLKLDTQVVSSAASIGCTIISGHTYVRDIQSEPTGWDTVMVKIDTSNVQLFWSWMASTAQPAAAWTSYAHSRSIYTLTSTSNRGQVHLQWKLRCAKLCTRGYCELSDDKRATSDYLRP